MSDKMTFRAKYFVPGNSVPALMLNRTGDIGRIIDEYENVYVVDFADGSPPSEWSHDDGYTAATKKEAEKIARFYLRGQDE